LDIIPRYSNIDNNGNIINVYNSDGSSDVKVPESNLNEYRDYTFTADDIAPFTSFAIKIIGSSSNQVYTPIIKDLRVIALR
jgi:hypothetical protein